MRLRQRPFKIGCAHHAERHAFTLVELLVAIAIVGIISTVAVVATGNSREKGRIAAGMSLSGQIDRLASSEGGEWFLNEGSGTAANDGIGAGNNGTLMNGPTWSSDTPSGRGYSLSLDGLNDYVQVNSSSALKYAGGNMTLAVWIKPDPAETTGGCLISKPWNGSGEYNYSFSYGLGRISFGLSGSSVYGVNINTNIVAGRWSFVAVTVNSSRDVKIYIDGALKYSAVHGILSWTPAAGDGDTPLAIGTLFPYGGGWGGNEGFSFGGLIDEPRVFGEAFTAAQIRDFYAAGLKKHGSALAVR